MSIFWRVFGRQSGVTMNTYNFTERVRKVLQMAREEAQHLHHEYVGTEHMLLGLITESEGVASAVLDHFSIDRAAVRRTIEETVKRGTKSEAAAELPYTSRAKKVLELSMTEARELQHSYVGTEHLLLGLLREEKGIAAQVLQQHGLTLPASRRETLQLLGHSIAPSPAVAAAEGGRTPAVGAPYHAGGTTASVTVLIEHTDGSIVGHRFRKVPEALTFLARQHDLMQ